MPAAAAAVVAYAATISATTWFMIGTTALSLLMTLTNKPKTLDQTSQGTLINTRSPEEVVALMYGKGRIGGNQVFATTTGTDNKYLHVILTLSEGEINNIVQVDSVDQIFLNGELYTESDYKDIFTYEFFNGSSTQNVCSTLNTAYPDWTDKMRYTSYLYYRIKYDRDKFLSQPTVTVVLEGLKVKNFETEDDYASMPMFYTNNLAYCVYDLLTRPSVRGGKGLDPTRIDLTSFRDAATYYNTYGWTCNLPMKTDQSVEDNLAMLLINGRSDIVYSDSKFKLKFRDTREESVCMQITKNDIIQSGKESTMVISPVASLFSRPNAIKATYYCEDKNYHSNEKVFQDDDAYGVEGDYRELSINLLGLSSLDKVIPMSYYYLERARWGNTVNIIVGNKGIALEPFDLVEITSVMPGWTDTAKPMYRVESAQLQKDGNVVLSLIQEHDDLYNDDYDIDTSELFITDLPKPGNAPLSVVNISHAEEVYYYRNKSYTRWIIDFDPPSVSDDPFWDYAEIWLKIGTGNYVYMTKSTSDYMIDPVEEGETYSVKIRSVSVYGVKEDVDSCIVVSKLIIGKTGVPPNMSYLTISSVNDAIFIYGDEVIGPDIVGYEFRICAQSISDWGGSVYLGFNSKPNWSLSGIRAGSYRIFCAPLNDAGWYSTTPIYADFTVQDPKGYTVYLDHDFDYAVGSHNNTEYYDLGGGNYAVRVTHTGGLEGTWTSPIVDVGEVRHLRVQGDFVLQVLDVTATWEGLWPSPNIWTSLDVENKTWDELMGTQKASRVEAKLKWGSANVSEHSVDKFELMSVDTEARYYQLEVKLTDPHYDQYVLLDGSGGNTILTLSFMR